MALQSDRKGCCPNAADRGRANQRQAFSMKSLLCAHDTLPCRAPHDIASGLGINAEMKLWPAAKHVAGGLRVKVA